MTKKNITISAMAAVLILAMAAMAIAGPGYGRGPGSGNCPAFSQLTPEKQAEVDAIMQKYEPKFDELRTAMWTKHSVLQAMINDGDSNEKKMGKLTAEMTTLKTQMRDMRTAMSEELTTATGIDLSQVRGGRGRGCGGYQQSCAGNYGGGFQRGQGYGRGMGQGPAQQ